MGCGVDAGAAGWWYRSVLSRIVRQAEHAPSYETTTSDINAEVRKQNYNALTRHPALLTFHRVALRHSLHEISANFGGDACASALLHAQVNMMSQLYIE
jgi:hypothetical protein